MFRLVNIFLISSLKIKNNLAQSAYGLPRARKYLKYLNPSDDEEEQHSVLAIPRTSQWRLLNAPQNYDREECDEDDEVNEGEGDNDGGRHNQSESEDSHGSDDGDRHNQSESEDSAGSDDRDGGNINNQSEREESAGIDDGDGGDINNQSGFEESAGSDRDLHLQHRIAQENSAESADHGSESESGPQTSENEQNVSECNEDNNRAACSMSSDHRNLNSDEGLLDRSADNNVNNDLAELEEEQELIRAPEEEEREDNAYFPVLPPEEAADAVLQQPDNEFKRLKSLLDGDFSEILTALPKISSAQLLLNSLNLIKQYNINHSQSEGVMRLINSIFQANVLPNSRHLLDKILKSACGSNYHFLCSKCKHYLGQIDYENIHSVECEICETENCVANLESSTFFVMFDIPTQLELLLNDKKVSSVLKSPHLLVNDNDNGPIKDLYDGTMYQNFARKVASDRNFRHISFCFSYDGSPLFKTNHKQIWPIFIKVLELPPQMRGHRLMIGGLWFGKNHPITNVYLQPFIEHMNTLSINGFKIKVDNEMWKMKVHLLCCCADAPARAAVQCIHQHNGFAGCNWCLHPGEHVGPGRRKYFILDHLPELRSAPELERDARAALRMGGPKTERQVNRVLDLSPILGSVSMDAVDGMILDFMHHADHGLGHQVPASWFGEHGAYVDYYIGTPTNRLKMTNLIKSIRLPVEARRPARDTEEFSEYQARDHQNFNLLFGVPLLMEIDKRSFKKYLKHWVLFVQGYHLLLQTEVPRENINLAHLLLTEFVAKFEEVYGEDGGREHMSYNAHITFHAAQNSLRWGPPWALNAYCFEAGNKVLKGVIASGRGIASQVCRAISKECAIKVLEMSCGSDETDRFLHDIKKDLVERCIYIGEDKYLGSQKTFNPSEAEDWVCARMNLDTSAFVQVEKLIHLSCVYAPVKQGLKTDNSIASLKDKTFVYIEKIIVSENDTLGYLVVKRIHEFPTMVPHGVLPQQAFLRKISFTEADPFLVSPTDLDTVCARITLPKGDYIIKMPNINNTY